MQKRYSSLNQGFHWISATLMLATLPVAWVLLAMPVKAPRFMFLLDLHKGIGLIILALTLLRIVWRLVEPPPPLPRSLPGWNRSLAYAVYGVLFLVMLAMPISGYLWTTAHGYELAPFGFIHFPMIAANNKPLGDFAKQVHYYGQWVVYGAILFHLLGLGFHVFIRRDGALERMLPAQERRDDADIA